MDALDIALVIGTAIKWLVYTALLWIMIKIQKLNYHLVGLFASSLAATLIWYIPFVGTYLSYAVLVICLWKCTRADIAPDVIFTVGIAGALMFCFNLWIIGMLMGSLRPDLAKGPSDAESSEMVDDIDEDAEEPDPDDDQTEDAPADAAPAAPTAPRGGRVAARTTAATKPPPPTRTVSPVMDAGPFTLKGVSLGSARPSVMISDGRQIHTVGRGDSFTADLPEGRTRLRCEDITKTHVILKNGSGQIMHLELP